MTTELPESVARKLLRLTLETAPMAYFGVGKDGRLKELGGDLGAFALEHLRVGLPAADQALFLQGLFP